MYQIEDPEDLPEPIQNLVGKSFCFGISISSDNVTNGAGTYLVAEVRAGEEIHKIESQSAPVSLIESGSSTFSAGEVHALLLLKSNSMLPIFVLLRLTKKFIILFYRFQSLILILRILLKM